MFCCFFKQKTAYEMRISDWSSDVCSSDLARAQNMGNKAVDLLKLIPGYDKGSDLAVIERCSGHGGSWGVRKDFFEVGMKVGKPVARTAVKENKAHIASECPLAEIHIRQGMEREGTDKEGFTLPASAAHPVAQVARYLGLFSELRSAERRVGNKG